MGPAREILALMSSNTKNSFGPHPKDGEGNVFTGVCPFNFEGGGVGGVTPVPGSFPGPFWGYPSPSWGGGDPKTGV